jgi:RND superfamily putative drug exporter
VGRNVAGLDWKVPIYLFTLLLALGEDYNILLLSRVKEEQQHHGTIGGILVALRKTGSIISRCGVIMAGTLASLMTGTLMGLVQLGFALSFGVLLDTFVIRPVIVPAWLLMLNTGRLGPLGRWLGAERVIVPPPIDKSSDASMNALREAELK